MGYCMGVRRAMEVAEDAVRANAVRTNADRDAAQLRTIVYTYGPIIHNPVALARLEREGVVVLGKDGAPLPDDFFGATVIIRAHGIPPAEREELVTRHATIVDATCPRVLSSQKRAKRYHDAGYAVILAGDRNHGEIAGIAGYAPGCIVLENREDAERLGVYPEKAALISQTTIKQSEYDAIASFLSLKIPDLKVFNTICPATQERQNALADLAGKVEGILVIGGKASANTQRLFNTALAITGKAWHIETPDEIPEEVFSLNSVGLTAGASTPDEVITAVEQALQKG